MDGGRTGAVETHRVKVGKASHVGTDVKLTHFLVFSFSGSATESLDRTKRLVLTGSTNMSFGTVL